MDDRTQLLEALAGGPEETRIGPYGRVLLHDDAYWLEGQVTYDGVDAIHCRRSDWIKDWSGIVWKGIDQGWGMSPTHKLAKAPTRQPGWPLAVVAIPRPPFWSIPRLPFWRRWLERGKKMISIVGFDGR